MDLLFCYAVLATFLVITSSIHAHNTCRSSKLEKCFCGGVYYFGNRYYMVNCTDTGFKDASMLRDIPLETEAVLFTGNYVESLPENIFGDTVNYTKLKVIDMSNNHIKDILGKTFHHVPNVETLILNHNDIRIEYNEDRSFHHPRVFSNFINLRQLHLTNAFADNTDDHLANDLHDIFDKSNLTQLFRLHLEQNEIRGFKDPKVFCNLPKLTQLYLGNNLISHIDFNSFSCLNLQFLDLRNNTITDFSDNDLRALDYLKDISKNDMGVDVNGNPLKCSALSNFYQWIGATKVKIHDRDHLKCYISSGNAKVPVNLKAFAEGKHAKLSKAITVMLVILGLVMASLLAAYAYMNKDRLKQRMSPILDVVSRKVHYTTIESQIV